jgi:hypothetical protein
LTQTSFAKKHSQRFGAFQSSFSLSSSDPLRGADDVFSMITWLHHSLVV